jgi:hypothetical protein
LRVCLLRPLRKHPADLSIQGYKKHILSASGFFSKIKLEMIFSG